MKYKINIHAHSIFSDGVNSPYVMALHAKKADLTALVITDHFYGKHRPEFMSELKMVVLKKACREAREILPIIIGLEIPFMGQEVLVFGGVAINEILKNDLPDMNKMMKLKKETNCAVILCHPGKFDRAAPAVDGFERFNSGIDYFKNNRPFDDLTGKPMWCNSDAHTVKDIRRYYNIVDTKIEVEQDLIKYIKSGKQPEHFIYNKSKD